MKALVIAAIVSALPFGVAYAQSTSSQPSGAMKTNSMNKHDAAGTTGAMGNANANGIATDPAGVKAQQGRSATSSPGTVGAAPGANTNSQKPQH